MHTVEKLVHFRCPKCQGWWTVGDAPIDSKQDWYCPWCGVAINEKDAMPPNGLPSEKMLSINKMLSGDEELLSTAAFYFRHDYGLLYADVQKELRWHAKEWLRACMKAAGYDI